MLYIGGRLAAILVAAPSHDAAAWTLVAGFGIPLARGATFASLAAFEERLRASEPAR